MPATSFSTPPSRSRGRPHASTNSRVTAGPAAANLASLPNVSIGEIAAFVALVECRSFTVAARSLYLSQPGLSARIARLERALGMVLVERSSRDLTLTLAGRDFAGTARDMLKLFASVSAGP